MIVSLCKRRALVAAVLSSLVASSHVAVAQPKPAKATPVAAAPAEIDRDATKKDEARARFMKGVELVQNQAWDAALAEFLASRALYPTRAALNNAAIALRQLKRNAEALEMYEELVAGFGPALSSADRRTVDQAIAQLRGVVGDVTIVDGIAGALVVVDGRQRGALPIASALRLDEGTHHVRVFKEGYVPFETELLLAGGQRADVRVALVALAEAGKLRVEETSGKALDVVVDGAVVGATPWVGTLSIGKHTVLLRGADELGSPPAATDVKAGATTTLRLEATVLDASLRVEPVPSNARVDVDGVEVGLGVWEGRLKSAAHRVEVTADGFLPGRRDLKLGTGEREAVRVELERDLSNPRWSTFRPHLYAEAVGGLTFAPSFGGGADGACGAGACSSSSHPPGLLVGARGGFQLTRGLGVELFFGYLRASEHMSRTKTAQADVPATSSDYADSTTLSAPLVAASVSYTFFEKTPLTARFWGGAARASVDFTNRGTFQGTLTDAQSGQRFDFSQSVSVPEASPSIWIPFVAPEARVGYRLTRRFSVDVGLAAFFMLAPATARVGTTALDKAESTRAAQLTSTPRAFANGDTANPGLLRLDPDAGFSTFVALVPTIAVRADF